MSRSLPHVVLLLLAAGLPAQRSMTWNPVHNTVRYECRLYNPGAGPAREVVIHVPLPQRDARQEIRYLHLSKPGLREQTTDVHGQRHARYVFDEIPPGGFVEVGFVAGATLRNLRWIDPDRPERPGGPTLAPEERERYLASASNYSMQSPLLRETAERLVEGALTEFEKVERIHDFIIEKIHYVMDGKWDTAEQVLIQGHGSCSEYNYLLSGLCRLAGLPTRYVGGSSRRPGTLPVTDVVYHRWTEVFLEGVGWFPVDCSRDSNPIRGKRSHFGKVHSDMIVWCRQAGGGDDLLEWEYRAQARWAEGSPRLRADHRTRWFAYVKPEELAGAREWLASGKGPVPGPDALECSLIDWEQADPSARLGTLEALSKAGRAECLRRAADLTYTEGQEHDLFGALIADPGHAALLREMAREPNRFRAWFKAEEAGLEPTGTGTFRLAKKERAEEARVSGPLAPLWSEMASGALADLGKRFLSCSPGPVLLVGLTDLTGGTGEGLEELGALLRGRIARQHGRTLLDEEKLSRHMAAQGPGKGEFWALLRPESEVPGSGLPQDLRPALVIAPVALMEPIDGNPREQRLKFELRVLDLPRETSFTCVEARLHRMEDPPADTLKQNEAAPPQ